MEFAVCLKKMRIGTFQGDAIKPGPAFPSINSFVLWKFDGMLGKQGTYPVSELCVVEQRTFVAGEHAGAHGSLATAHALPESECTVTVADDSVP
jgi:hypothetical protein